MYEFTIYSAAMKHPDKIRKKETWIFCFTIWGVLSRTFAGFYHEYSRITGLPGKGEGISLTPQYHFHPLRRRLGIGRAFIVGGSPLHIASSRTRTGSLLGFIKVLILLGLLLRFMWLQTLATVWHSLLAFLLMCWYKSQSSVFFQDEFQAVLLFW